MRMRTLGGSWLQVVVQYERWPIHRFEPYAYWTDDNHACLGVVYANHHRDPVFLFELMTRVPFAHLVSAPMAHPEVDPDELPVELIEKRREHEVEMYVGDNSEHEFEHGRVR